MSTSQRKLDDYQKELLQELLVLSNNVAESLYDKIDFALEHSSLPPKGSRTVIGKQIIKPLKEIEKTAKKLRVLLMNFEDSSMETVEFVDYDEKTYEIVSTYDIVQAIEQKAGENVNYIKLYIGNSYLAHVLDNLFDIWDEYLKRAITVSADSDFVRFVAIVLEDDPETTFKQVQRARSAGRLTKPIMPFEKDT